MKHDFSLPKIQCQPAAVYWKGSAAAVSYTHLIRKYGYEASGSVPGNNPVPQRNLGSPVWIWQGSVSYTHLAEIEALDGGENFH